MTAASTTRTPTPTPAPAPERGRLTIADRVVERLVVAAAGEVDGVETSAVSGLVRRGASATVRRVGDDVTASLRTAMGYPLGLAATAEATRERVRTRVEGTTGLRVSHVDIEVTGLHDPTPRPGRRVLS